MLFSEENIERNFASIMFYFGAKCLKTVQADQSPVFLCFY
jgi:hypothetical protein